MRRPVVTALALALVCVLAVAAYLAWDRNRDTAFESAVASAPAGAERLSWTDWAGVRRELGSDVDVRSSPGELQSFLDEAFDADLASRSALLESAVGLHESFGISPATVEWELFSQSQEGAAITLRLPDDTDFDELADRVRDLGYSEPDSETGVWSGGPDLLPQIDANLTPELAYLALDADDGLVLASDGAAFLEVALAAVTGGGEAVEGVDEVASALDDPLSAAVYSGDYACAALAMAQADAGDQDEAARLVEAAGTVDPYRAFAMGKIEGGDVRVVMEFADDDQARANADSRAVLATGPAVGQGGDFGDRFTLESARADGRLVLLDLDPASGAYVLSDLTSGPVLFATC